MPLFKEPIVEWNSDRANLVEWLIFYHNIRSIPDGAPSEDIISNDTKLDSWIKKFNLEKQQEKMGKGSKRKGAKRGKEINFAKQRGDEE